MWNYSQTTGELIKDGKSYGNGYSGTGGGRNNPAAQDIPNVGPLPQGQYTIGDAYDDPHLGPVVMHLDPTADTDTFGRSAFRMHGNNAANDASHGCLIFGPVVRRAVADSDDRDLTVSV